ncbi:conserved Plasmodium protein, unknown function [Plasmodium sp. gorilla clade G2]|uniref:conserved Plasmodium protein, unknown function n=1 Tax=Plasmodium sp. gorilla clade G2 TaxID=880535 RepID=UPI000D22239F|nr:conserved Plasmodium protein, unknown function [Plasmodium sp. gorilla clade G2]SOV19547.1 conserved Plasmodium protein, unknown function [Plasmodium sp. gorilla clade G2]
MEKTNIKDVAGGKNKEAVETPEIDNSDGNVFETLKKLFLEEQENNKRKYEELSDHLDKMKIYFDEKINSLKNNTHENFEELKYYLDNLNKKNKDTLLESNTFQESMDAIQSDISKLKKDKEENTNLIKSSIKTYFDKIKSTLNLMNTHVEKMKEEFTNYKENNEIENRKKNIDILQLINEENETLSKSMEKSLNNINSDIKDVKEHITYFKEHVEKQIKDINNIMEINRKEIDERIEHIFMNQKKLMGDFYPYKKN